MFVKSTHFKQVCQLLLSLIVALYELLKTHSFGLYNLFKNPKLFRIECALISEVCQGEGWGGGGGVQCILSCSFVGHF